MTKLTDPYVGTFTASLPTEPPPVPERHGGEVRRKAVRKPRKRVLKPRNPDWRLGDGKDLRAPED